MMKEIKLEDIMNDMNIYCETVTLPRHSRPYSLDMRPVIRRIRNEIKVTHYMRKGDFSKYFAMYRGRDGTA